MPIEPVPARTRPGRRPTSACRRDGRWIALVHDAGRVPEDSRAATTVPQSRSVEGAPPRRDGPAEVTQFPARIHDLCWAADGHPVRRTELGGVHNDLWQVPLDDPARAAASSRRPGGRGPPQRLGGRPLAALHRQPRRRDRPGRARPGRSGDEQTRPAPARLRLRPPPAGHAATPRATRQAVRTTRRGLLLQPGDGQVPRPARVALPPAAGDVHFYCDGRGGVELPAGEYQLGRPRPRVPPVRRDMKSESEPAQSAVALELERWTQPAERGGTPARTTSTPTTATASGTTRPRTMRLQCAGEDLTRGQLHGRQLRRRRRLRPRVLPRPARPALDRARRCSTGTRSSAARSGAT